MKRTALLALVLSLLASLATAQDGADEITLVLGGDVIFDAPIEYALRRTDRDRASAASYAPLFEDLVPALSAADLAIVNLETPVATRTRSSGDGDAPRFAAPQAFLSALGRAGVDAVTLANNHAYDQGVAGLAETLSHVEGEHLAAVGAGATPTEARYLTVRGHTIALLAFAEGTNWRVLDDEAELPRVAILDADRVSTAVAAARERASFVAVAFHWTEGREHVPSPRMRRYARLAANAGADLVWGHGTHLPAGTSVVRAADGRAVPVIWSLGNLVAVMHAEDDDVFSSDPSVREAWLAQLVLRRAGERLEVASIGALPFWIGISEREDGEPFVRPLSLIHERELLRLRACGRRCERLSAAYEARSARAHRSLTLGSIEALDEALVEERLAVASLTPAPDEVHVAAPARATDVPELGPPEDAATTPRDPPHVEARAEAPHDEVRDRPREERATRTAADLGGLATGGLTIQWETERAIEAAVDEEQLTRLVTALRADGRLMLEIIAHPSGAEDRALWARRGARARGLVAMRGPSRSRVSSRLGSPEHEGRLEYRLVR